MARNTNTDSNGQQFSQIVVNQVWQKGGPISNYDSGIWRYDIYGQPIKCQEYGNINSKHGWEIDHIKPIAHGGGDELSNLQPLQWEKNREKSDNLPLYR